MEEIEELINSTMMLCGEISTSIGSEPSDFSSLPPIRANVPVGKSDLLEMEYQEVLREKDALIQEITKLNKEIEDLRPKLERSREWEGKLLEQLEVSLKQRVKLGKKKAVGLLPLKKSPKGKKKSVSPFVFSETSQS